MDQAQGLRLIVVVCLDNSRDEGVIHHSQNVVLPLHEFFKSLLQQDLLKDKVHLVVVLLLRDVDSPLVSGANLFPFEVDLINVFCLENTSDLESWDDSVVFLFMRR
jgi:hypothetical protein